MMDKPTSEELTRSAPESNGLTRGTWASSIFNGTEVCTLIKY
jgi:hypothetical protein